MLNKEKKETIKTANVEEIPKTTSVKDEVVTQKGNPKVIGAVLIGIVIAIVLTIFFKSAGVDYYGSGAATFLESKTPAGFFAIFGSLTNGARYGLSVALFVLAIGAFYGVLNSIPAYRRLIKSFAKIFSNCRILFVILTIVLVSVGVSLLGNYLFVIIIAPFIISIILSLKFNRVTAAMTMIGSIASGYLGSIFATKAGGLGYVYSTLKAAPNSYWLARVAALLASMAILILVVYLYSRGSNENDESLIFDEEEANAKNKNGSSIAIGILLAITFVVLLIATIPWESAFNIKLFANITTKINNNNIISKVLGKATAFGAWEHGDLIAVLFASSALIGIICNSRGVFKSMANGVKRVAKPALLILLIYTVFGIEIRDIQSSMYGSLIYSTSGGIAKSILSAGKFNVISMSIVAFFSHFLSIETMYTIDLTLPVVTALVSKSANSIALIWQFMKAFSMIIAPTSIVLIGFLSYLHVSYLEWIKKTWLYILCIFVLSLAIPLVISFIY